MPPPSRVCTSGSSGTGHQDCTHSTATAGTAKHRFSGENGVGNAYRPALCIYAHLKLLLLVVVVLTNWQGVSQLRAPWHLQFRLFNADGDAEKGMPPSAACWRLGRVIDLLTPLRLRTCLRLLVRQERHQADLLVHVDEKSMFSAYAGTSVSRDDVGLDASGTLRNPFGRGEVGRWAATSEELTDPPSLAARLTADDVACRLAVRCSRARCLGPSWAARPPE